MLFILILFVLPLALAIASYRWGVDSRDTLESKEWERRRLHCRSI